MSSELMRTYMTKLDEARPESSLEIAKRVIKNFFTINRKIGNGPIISINIEGKVDINGSIHYDVNGYKTFKKLPIQFGVVIGNVNFSSMGLTTLEGSPERIAGSFYCEHNDLTSLVGGPKDVGKYYFCADNKLISLEGLPIQTNLFIARWSENLPLLRLVGLNYNVQIGDRETPYNHIIRKYKGKGQTRSDILAAQKELIDAGFAGNASW